jgi:hypothetical protein
MSTEHHPSPKPSTKIEYGPWSDRPIKYMIYWTVDYVVYINESLELDFELSEIDPANTSEFNRFLNEAKILETGVSGEFDEGAIISSKALIGEGIACAIEGDFENAKIMLNSASVFIQARRQEHSRIWYVTASAVTTASLIVLEYAFWIFKTSVLSGTPDEIISWLALGAGAGAVGAFISIVARSGNLEFDPASGRILHRVEASLRILVGFTSGLVTALAIRAGLLLPAIAQDKNANLILLIAAFAAGGGERFVTSIISDVNALGIKGSKPVTRPKLDSGPKPKPLRGSRHKRPKRKSGAGD